MSDPNEQSVDWHAVIGFEPVARRGPLVMVSGTSGREPDGQMADDAYAQTLAAFRTIEARLAAVGGTADEIVGSRIFLRRAEDWPDAGRAHGQALGGRGVGLTMVEAKLVDPEMLVEVEAIAWLPQHDGAAPGHSA